MPSTRPAGWPPALEAAGAQPKEFAVLELPPGRRGLVVSAEELLGCWDEFADPFTTAVKATISGCGPSSATHPSSTPSARAGIA